MPFGHEDHTNHIQDPIMAMFSLLHLPHIDKQTGYQLIPLPFYRLWKICVKLLAPKYVANTKQKGKIKVLGDIQTTSVFLQCAALDLNVDCSSNLI